jgi:hypothetical protein
MSHLTDHANTGSGVSELTSESSFELLLGSVPVLATPVAVAAGVTLAVGAAGAGFAVEEANDN